MINLIYYNMFLLLFYLVSGISIENKEDQCFLLASHLIREKHEEIVKIIKTSSHLKFPEVKLKAIEDDYYYCMEHITNEEVSAIMTNKRKEYSTYLHLMSSSIRNFQTLDDIKLSDEFIEKRNEIS